ncbi:hypothetical protein ABZ897_12835, partial [Nonomuraea sp. NPDC046802]
MDDLSEGGLDLPESRWNRFRRSAEPEAGEAPDSSWNRFQQPKPESPWPRRLAAALSIIVVVPMVYAMPAYAAPRTAPSTQKETPVKGSKVPVLPPLRDPAAKQAWKAPPGVAWPKPQTAELGAATAGRMAASDFPIRLASAEDGAARSAATVDPVKVEILDTAATGRLGLAMRVSPGQGVAAAKASGKTRLRVDYSGFRYAYGGDYGARLRMVRLEECALDAKAVDCAQPKPVKTDNDPKAGTLTAEVETTGLYAVTAAAAGPSGDHSATSLAPSADWSVGTQTGDFSWSYEMRTPPTLGGDEPEIGLGYSSQSVDGRTSSTNNQASWAGEGFELNPGGYIERRYKSCMLDGKKTGDLCWDQDNATMSLGDSSV